MSRLDTLLMILCVLSIFTMFICVIGLYVLNLFVI